MNAVRSTEDDRNEAGSGPVLVIAGDPGGGSALCPVLKQLEEEGIEFSAFAYRQSAPLWARRGVAHVELEEGLGGKEVRQMLCDLRPSLILCGTSVNGVDLERQFVKQAEGLGIPTVALLDYWANYSQRFCGEEESHVIPDRIAVMDEVAVEEMIALGFDPEVLCVTGQPALDDLHLWATENRKGAGRMLRGDPPEQMHVLFASQPLEEMYGGDPSGEGYLGYTQHTVLPQLIVALREYIATTGREVILGIRPHPREEIEGYDRYVCEGPLQVLIDDSEEPKESALGADLVVGMNSVLLIEAGIMGCKVLSLQPESRGGDFLPLERLSLGEVVYVSKEIPDAVGRALEEHALEGGDLPKRRFTGSAKKVVNLVKVLRA